MSHIIEPSVIAVQGGRGSVVGVGGILWTGECAKEVSSPFVLDLCVPRLRFCPLVKEYALVLDCLLTVIAASVSVIFATRAQAEIAALIVAAVHVAMINDLPNGGAHDLSVHS